MKKNKMMRLASGLLVAVLITTSTISGTYAKYVTSAEGFDNARVAKFGVEITAATEMFSDSYKNAKTTYTANETTGEITVQASTEGTNVVAPGTNGSLVGFAVTGTPEVDVQVTYDATLTLAGWTTDGTEEYCPIVITVNGETYGTTVTAATHKYPTVADLKQHVEEAIEAKAAYYHTNTDLSAVNDDVVISWEWPFRTGADDAEKDANDVKDTALGDRAAVDKEALIKLEIKTTIEQVD